MRNPPNEGGPSRSETEKSGIAHPEFYRTGNDSATQFLNAIIDSGVTPPTEIIADGKLHRFSTNGKRYDKAGWYVLYPNDPAAGAFGCWRSQIHQTWCAKDESKLTKAERDERARKYEEITRLREVEKKARQAEAKKKAARIWNAAESASPDHPYLVARGVKAYEISQFGGKLLVPMFNAHNELVNLQRIFQVTEDRKQVFKKLFLTGGEKKGCSFLIGDPGSVICIAEGYSTAASIHEATGYTVAIAFDCGNLEPVARALRDKYPNARFIVCADDDALKPINAGLVDGTKVARAIGAVLAIPDFGADRPEGATDFNDLHQAQGLEAVKLQINSALSKNGGTRGTASNDAASSVPPEENDGGTGGTTDQDIPDFAESPIPGESDRPRFVVLEDWVKTPEKKYRPGVWWFTTKETSQGTVLIDTWICTPLHVEAVTSDGKDANFGRLLRFRNTLKRWREWAMPMELLRGSGEELRGELLSMGVEIDPAVKTLLANYLTHRTPKRRMQCALTVGWCGSSFVLPDTVIGQNAADVVFQNGERWGDEYTHQGNLRQWQATIAAYAVNNPMLILALSAAFAGPLLGLCNAEGGGLHFVDDSSTGKTTLLEAACSVWGGPEYRRSWRATANGMEGAASLFNDCLLALDEISECDPRDVGLIVYALANGRGKQRASRSGNARNVTRWRCMVLSSGERTITTTMQDGGFRVKAGQAVRLLDLPAKRAFGVWDNLHGLENGRAFSDAIKHAAITNYGLAGRAFLEKLTRDTRDFCKFLDRFKQLPHFSNDADQGQEKRTASRFALLAMAGELATEYGITTWAQGAAVEAAAIGFDTWRAAHGKGNSE